MMSSKPGPVSRAAVDRSPATSISTRNTPLQIIHVLGVFMRIWSVYSLYLYLSEHTESVTVFIFTSLLPASCVFLLLQKPWKGRALSNSQVVPSIINGGILALYFILWGKGLKSCAPLIAILAEYAGAALGVLSAVLYGRGGRIWKKVGGLVAMLAAFYFLSLGWATGTYSPFYSIHIEPLLMAKESLGAKDMVFPITAGILSALRRVVARRISLKNQLKRRLHAITVASAACFLFPLAIWDSISGSSSNIMTFQFPSWAYLSTIIFGIIFIFYVDNIAEERLHLIHSSPRHLIVTSGSIIIMEIVHKMDFSLLGFLISCSILGVGIHEATSLDRAKKDNRLQHISDEIFSSEQEMPPLPS